LQGPSQLSTPLYSQLILRIYDAMNGLGGGGAKTEFAPGRGKPEVRHWVRPTLFYSFMLQAPSKTLFRTDQVVNFKVVGD